MKTKNSNLLFCDKKFIATKLGEIAVYTKLSNSNNIPIIFLHGVYFDHNLWTNQVAAINDRTVITIDMPLHGESKKGVPDLWTLSDCGDILKELLDALNISKICAIGHSWGSMTILRAVNAHPERFSAVGFCNMSFVATSIKQKISFNLQHMALIFRNFYIKQVAKTLFGKETFKQKTELLSLLTNSMNKLTNKQIKLIDKFVIINADDTTQMIKDLKIPALALKGEEDYVPTPPSIKTTIIQGGHVSPIESHHDVTEFCKQVIQMVK